MVTIRSYLNNAVSDSVSGIEKFSTNICFIFLLHLFFSFVRFPHFSTQTEIQLFPSDKSCYECSGYRGPFLLISLHSAPSSSFHDKA